MNERVVKNPNFKNNGEFHKSLAARGAGAKDWPNTHTEVEHLGGGKFAASIGVGHRVFFDKADSNKPKKHKLTDERPAKDYVLIQGAKCCVEVYPYYAKYFDVQHEEVRLYEERWVVQRLFRDPDEWRDVDAYNPVISSEETANRITVTVTYTTDYGVLAVKYIQEDGNALRHAISFRNTSGGTETFRVLQRWAGIVGEKCNGRSPYHDFDEPFLAFHKADKSKREFTIAENLSRVIFNPDGTEKTAQCLQRPVIIESHPQGMKADFIYERWVVAPNETFNAFTIETNPPTSCDAGWANCANAEADDSSYAEATTNGQQGEWSGYGFNLETGCPVNHVWVRIKHYTLDSSKHSISLEVWNGSEWGTPHSVPATETPCTEDIIDVSGDFLWTSEMVNAIKVRLTANIGGGSPGNKKVMCCYLPVEVDYEGCPDTATLDNPTQDGSVFRSDSTQGGCPTGDLTRTAGDPLMYLGGYNIANVVFQSWRAYVEWSISGLAGEVLDANPVFKYEVIATSANDEEINPMSMQPSLASDASLYADIASGVAYVNPWTVVVGGYKEVDLGAAARTSLQNALDVSQSWWAIGLQSPGDECPGSPSDPRSCLVTEENPTPEPPPTLYLEYTPAAGLENKSAGMAAKMIAGKLI